MYTLFVGNGPTKKDCLLASLVPCDPETVVHTKKMKVNEAKFLIHEVLDMWNEFDGDVHLPGAYVVWDKDHCVVNNDDEEEEEEEKNEKKKEEGKKSGKMKGGKKKSKQPDGKTFRRNVGKICEEKEDAESDEEEDELTEKKTTNRRKQKEKEDAESDEEEDELTENKTKNRRKRKGVVEKKEGDKHGKKKAKLRKTRKAPAKVTMGKKAADKVREKKKDKDKKLKEENELDYGEEEEEQEDELSLNEKEKKRKEELNEWKQGGWKVDPRVRVIPGAHLYIRIVEAQKVHVLKVLEKSLKDGVPQEKKNNRYQKMCYYCQHNPLKAPEERKTSWYCEGCVGPNGEIYPLCDPRTGRKCFTLHLTHGLPPKRRYTGVKDK